jgi:hypothetical protein
MAGSRFPPDVLQRMEAAFGQSLTQVRVHVGPHVQAMGALAFTQGSNIHFALGQYNPATPQGPGTNHMRSVGVPRSVEILAWRCRSREVRRRGL